LPLSAAVLEEHFTEFLISESDVLAMENALVLAEPTVEMVKTLIQENNPIYELVNLERAIQVLQMIPEPLQVNIRFAEELISWRGHFIATAAEVLNKIPALSRPEQKQEANAQISALFETILRNKEFSFGYMEVIHEAQVVNLAGLCDGLAKGYFFHLSLEEELKKVPFGRIKERIPADLLKKAEEIEKRIRLIRKGVERAYDVNMRMVGCAVHLYSHVKWLHQG